MGFSIQSYLSYRSTKVSSTCNITFRNDNSFVITSRFKAQIRRKVLEMFWLSAKQNPTFVIIGIMFLEMFCFSATQNPGFDTIGKST